MKKLALYTLMFLGGCLTACDEDFNTDVVQPQSYPQEGEQSVEGFTVVKDNGFSTLVLTEDMLTANAAIPVFSITGTPDMPEGATASLRLEVAKTVEFEGAVELPSQSADGVTSISPVDLNEIVKTLYGKAPQARDLHIRAYIYINDGKSSSMMPEPAAFGPVSVTPVGPVIESAYYLYGAPTGWDKNNVLKFSHSGKDVYEDPIFTIMVPAVKNGDGSVADCWFKIASQSSVDAQTGGGDLESVGILGSEVNGDESLEGTLVTENPQAKKIPAGDYQYIRITLNMMEYSYKIELLNVSPYLWVPGSHQGWNPEAAPQLYSRGMDMVYNGHLYLDGGFKLVAQPAWGPVEYNYTSFTTISPNVTKESEGSTNMFVDPGFYFVKADLNTSTFTATLINSWGVIGTATPGIWDYDTPMQYNREDNTWTVTTTLTDGELKFRANGDWAINMGNAMDKLLFNSDNIKVSAGTYKLILHLSNDDNSYCEMIPQP